MVFPTSNLPTVSQTWGREVQKRIENAEKTAITNEINNIARDAQLASSYRRLDAAVISAQAAIDGLGTLDQSTSTYKINAANITVGNLSGNRISGGTISGSSLETVASSYVGRVVISGTSSTYYDVDGNSTGYISAVGNDRAGSIGMNHISGTAVEVYNGGVIISGGAGATFDIGTSSGGWNTLSGRLIINSNGNSGAGIDISGGGDFNSGWQNTAGSQIASGVMASANASGNAAGFSRIGDNGTLITLYRGTTTAVGSISVTTTATAFNTSSDYRLKENVVPLVGALDRLSLLKPSRFNFIIEPDKTVDGFLAHEAYEVVPEAVLGEKDAVNDDGTPDYQAIDQSKLVPLLVAAVQELSEKVKILEGS